MMLLNVYTLHDVKALEYNQPFFINNHGLAKRMVADLVIDMNTTVGRHPADFKLYCLGTYETTNGAFTVLPVMEHVVDAVSLLPVDRQKPLFDRTLQNGLSIERAV